MNLWQCGLLLFLTSTANLPLHAQNSDTPHPTSGPMVRVERVYDGEDACVLLSRSGDYRLERHFPNQTKVYLGLLNPEEISRLQEVLDSPQLMNLSQADIHHELVTDTLDQFVVDIMREGEDQKLIFTDRSARKPFRASLEPVLDWLNQVKKGPHTEISSQSANRCSPGQVATAQRAGEASVGSYLLLITRAHAGGGFVDRGCTVVYGDGKFVAEEASGRYSGQPRTRGITGELGAAQVSELRQLLDEPHLRQAQNRPNTFRGLIQDSEIVNLTIPRDSTLQVLTLTNIFGRFNSSSLHQEGSAGVMRYEDPNARLLDPIEKWIKGNVMKGKFVPLPEGKATGCASSHS